MIEMFLTCLALNVYYEARSEPMDGQYAVAHVVLNRVADDSFPDDACKVVKQGYHKGRHRCQFSWYCDGKSDKPKDNMSWIVAQVVAYNTLYGYHKDNTHGATHYHATYVNPWWRKHYDKTVAHGSHIFYK